MKQHKRTKRIALVLAAAATFAFTATACTNPEVPAGHEGYIYHIPLIFGKMEYRKSLRGPASTGVSWRLSTINIDMRQRTYTEMFQLLTADNLRIKFEVNTAIKLRDGHVKEIVEEWGGKNWYEWRVKEPMRTAVRRAVAAERADHIQTQTRKLAREILASLKARYGKTPVEIRSVDIGHIEFPARYAQAIRKKIARTEELKRQAAELLKTEEEAKKKIVNALNVRLAQHIITESLSPLYVQYQAIQVYKKLAASKNKAIMLLPTTVDGTGLPQVLSKHGKLRTLTDEDNKYLKQMRKEYIDEATLKAMRKAVNQLKDEAQRETERIRRLKNDNNGNQPAPKSPKKTAPKKATPPTLKKTPVPTPQPLPNKADPAPANP